MFDVNYQCCYDLTDGWTHCYLCVGDNWHEFSDPNVQWFWSSRFLSADTILAKGREINAMLSPS